MCFLKNLGPEQHAHFDELFAKGEDSSVESSEQEPNVLIPCMEKQMKAVWSEEQQMLVNLFGLL